MRGMSCLATIGMLVLALASAFSATAASNTVTSSSVSDTSQPITANDLKPAECGTISLTKVVTGSGTFAGSLDNELVLASGTADSVSADVGNDCVLGGGSNDTLYGESDAALLGGDDVILGGPGDDAIDGGPGTDICYGGAGTDTFANCETTSQD